MARVEIQETVQYRDGEAVDGASVQVNVRGGGAATVYAAASGGTTKTNPLTTDNGRVEGYLEEGSYDLVISGTGITSYTQPIEVVSATSGGLAGHVADTTDVHGITDTAQVPAKNAVQTFTQQQTIDTSVSGAAPLVLRTVTADGSVAPELHFAAQNGLETNKKAWGLGIDIAAATPSRDFALFKFLTGSSGVSDTFYISHNGTNPATFGFNWAQPPGDMNVNFLTPTALSSMGGVRIRQSTANSGIPLLVETLAPATVFSVAIDGTVNAGKSLNVNGASSSSARGFSLAMSGEAVPRLEVLVSGTAKWSDGTNAADCQLSRGGANRLDLTDTEIRGFRASSSVLFATAVTGDGNRRWQAQSDGAHKWGTGGASPDVSIDRPGTAALRMSASGTPGTNERFRIDGTGVGFFGTAPVAKPTLSAAATDLASVITLANDIRTRLINYGLAA